MPARRGRRVGLSVPVTYRAFLRVFLSVFFFPPPDVFALAAFDLALLLAFAFAATALLALPLFLALAFLAVAPFFAAPFLALAAFFAAAFALALLALAFGADGFLALAFL